MKTNKIIYWVATGFLSALMLFSASMYFTKTDMVRGFFEHLEYPTYLVIPLAVAKILGLVAILTRKQNTLKEWAYAGFFFDTVLATAAHIDKGDDYIMSGVGIILVLVSYIYEKKAFAKS